jgi:hypothetical protein
MHCLVSISMLAGTALAQSAPPAPYHPERHRGPYLNLTDAKTVATRYSGDSALTGSLRGSQTHALSTATGDFDEDGINTAFGTPLAVQLLDTYGNPVGSNWGNTSFIEAAGTSGASATFSGSISVGADNNGVYTAPTLTANGIAGALNVLAYYFNASTNSALYQTFTLTNTTSVPAAVTATSGTPQSTAVGTAFATALSAKVTDSGNNPLAGFTVTFVPPSSGASATLSSSSAITNSAGVASVTLPPTPWPALTPSPRRWDLSLPRSPSRIPGAPQISATSTWMESSTCSTRSK